MRQHLFQNNFHMIVCMFKKYFYSPDPLLMKRFLNPEKIFICYWISKIDYLSASIVDILLKNSDYCSGVIFHQTTLATL